MARTRSRPRGAGLINAVLTDEPAAASAARARALADKVQLGGFTGTYYQMDQAGEALAIARKLDDRALLARVLAANGYTCSFSPEVALPYFQEAIGLARALGDNWQLGWVLAGQAYSAFIAGYPIAVLAAAEEGRDLADTIGDLSMSRMCRWCLGCAQVLKADLAPAAAQFSEVALEAQKAQDPMWTAYSQLMLGMTLAYQGDTGSASAAAEAAIEAATDVTGLGQGASFGALANAFLAAGCRSGGRRRRGGREGM